MIESEQSFSDLDEHPHYEGADSSPEPLDDGSYSMKDLLMVAEMLEAFEAQNPVKANALARTASRIAIDLYIQIATAKPEDKPSMIEALRVAINKDPHYEGAYSSPEPFDYGSYSMKDLLRLASMLEAFEAQNYAKANDLVRVASRIAIDLCAQIATANPKDKPSMIEALEVAIAEKERRSTQGPHSGGVYPIGE
jgi:hypothetical protein